jgi:hypothetical protein
MTMNAACFEGTGETVERGYLCHPAMRKEFHIDVSTQGTVAVQHQHFLFVVAVCSCEVHISC